MAANNPAANNPPPVPPVLPDVPFHGTPGSLTGWIQIETANDSPMDVMSFITSVSGVYDAMHDPLAHPGHYARDLQNLEDQTLGAIDFTGYLSVSTVNGQPARVNVVSNLGRFSTGLGTQSSFNGKVFGFFGEVIDDQLPPMVMIPDGVQLKELLTIHERPLPTAAQLAAHYNAGTGATLVPGLAAGAPVSRAAQLLALPTRWVPYFLKAMAPAAALETMRLLVASLPIQEQRDEAQYMIEWCLMACVRSGAGNVQRTRSQLNVAWASPTVPDRKLMAWANRRLTPFRIMPQPPAPNIPAAAFPPMDPQA